MERQLADQPKPRMRLAPLLVLGNLVVAAILVVVTVLSLKESRESDKAFARQAADNLANSVAIEVGAELRLVDNGLATIAGLYARASEAQRQQVLAEAVAQQRVLLPQVMALRAADAHGAVQVGLGRDEPPTSVWDRPYFEQARHVDTMVMSEPVRSRVTGQWSIVLARRLVGADGGFAGVVYAVMTSDHFTDRFRTLDLGDAGAMALRTDSMRLVSWFSTAEPRMARGYGEVNPSPGLVRQFSINRDHGEFEGRTGLDGQERISAYRRIPDYPLIAITGLGTQSALASWRREALVQAALVAVILLTIAAFSLYIHRKHGQERRARIAALKLAREQNLMLDNDLVGMMRVRDRSIAWNNRALDQILGYLPSELQGAPTRQLHLDDASYDKVCNAGGAALAAGRRFRTQIKMRKKNGDPVWIDVSGMAVSDTESLWMLADIEALKRSEESAYDLALRDALTGLPNRRLFEEKLSDVLAHASRDSRNAAVCFIDLDGFKLINDTHGHDAGDAVLREVGTVLQDTVRGNDVVARLGGDEFALVLSSVPTLNEAIQVMQRCRERIRRQISLGKGLQVSVDASVGIAIGNGTMAAPDLIRRADEAMYIAKRGHTGIHVWQEARGHLQVVQGKR